MGRNHRVVSDPSIATSHKAGSPFEVIQMLEHKTLGTICYTWPRHWVVHDNSGFDAYEGLKLVHAKVAALPVGSSAIRGIHEQVLIEHAYDCGCRMVLGVVLAMQHLCEAIERALGLSAPASTLERRIAIAWPAAGLELAKDEPGYSAFQEISAVRDAIEHPV